MWVLSAVTQQKCILSQSVLVFHSIFTVRKRNSDFFPPLNSMNPLAVVIITVSILREQRLNYYA